MNFWMVILGAIAIGLAASFKSGGKISARRKSDFRENEFDDEIEDFDRFFDDDL